MIVLRSDVDPGQVSCISTKGREALWNKVFKQGEEALRFAVRLSPWDDPRPETVCALIAVSEGGPGGGSAGASVTRLQGRGKLVYLDTRTGKDLSGKPVDIQLYRGVATMVASEPFDETPAGIVIGQPMSDGGTGQVGLGKVEMRRVGSGQLAWTSSGIDGGSELGGIGAGLARLYWWGAGVGALAVGAHGRQGVPGCVLVLGLEKGDLLKRLPAPRGARGFGWGLARLENGTRADLLVVSGWMEAPVPEKVVPTVWLIDSETGEPNAHRSEKAPERLGDLVAIGDVNSDGRDDVLVGVPSRNAVLCLSGKDLSVLWESEPFPPPGAGYGGALGVLRDLNGDGCRDCVVLSDGTSERSGPVGLPAVTILSGNDGRRLSLD
jgi:hypothetical protein